MNTCRYCNKEYEAKTARSKYCSHSCRAMANKTAQPDTAQPAQKTVAQPDAKSIDLSPDTNPNTTQPVTLSDGQQFYLDPRPAQHIAEHRPGACAPYQQQLATLSLQYDVIHGSDKARARARQVLDKEGGAWC